VTELGRAAAARSAEAGERLSSPLRIAWGAATDVGRRRRLNEDSYLAEWPLFVVADGMGGHAAGDVASAAVVSRLEESVSGDFADPARVIQALRTATDDITRADDLEDVGVGTTVTGAALTVRGGEPVFAVFNIGDSRVYRLDDEGLAQITVDHSVVQELVDAGLLARDEAEFHPDSNVITRAVGFGAEPYADFWMLPATAGLRLLICSDGLTRELPDEELRDRLNGGRDAGETARELVDAAVEVGGRDNVTAIVVDVVEGPAGPSQRRTGELADDLEQTAPKPV